MAKHTVCKVSEIEEGKGRAFEIDGQDIAVFRTVDGFHAIRDFCKHRGGILSQGELDGTTVTCPDHGWKYDVTSGQCFSNPDGSIERYNVIIDGDDVKVEV